MTFAKRLRDARLSAELTQEQLGFLLGVSKAAVSAWENSRETPSFKLLPGLREALGRSLDELICGEDGSVREDPVSYAERERNSEEVRLLMGFRGLPPKRRKAVLVLVSPDP